MHDVSYLQDDDVFAAGGYQFVSNGGLTSSLSHIPELISDLFAASPPISIPQKAGNASGYPYFEVCALSDIGRYKVKVLTWEDLKGRLKKLYFHLELVVYCKGSHHKSIGL